MKYRILTGTIREVESMVNIEMDHDWEPLGGLCITEVRDLPHLHIHEYIQVAQAMIYREPKHVTNAKR